jgi:tRNA G37 N-methylase TrmD
MKKVLIVLAMVGILIIGTLTAVERLLEETSSEFRSFSEDEHVDDPVDPTPCGGGDGGGQGGVPG